MRFVDLEGELIQGTFLDDPSLAVEVAEHYKYVNARFLTFYREARAAFAHLLDRSESLTATVVINSLQERPLWKFASDFHKIETGKELVETDARIFIKACPPVHSFRLRLGVAQYHWAVTERHEKALFKAEALDVFMAVYLPYCERFVTKDPGQCNILRLVAAEGGLATEVCDNAGFRRELLVGTAPWPSRRYL